MRGWLTGVLTIFVVAGAASSAQAPAPSTKAGQTTWFFYTVKWGYQNEFLDLFQRNHYPVLEALRKAGRFSSIRTFVPTNHGDGRADWTFAVELVEVADAPEVDEAALIAKLYPDQERFKKEEQRRFELLVAHWDVPLNVVDFEQREPWGQ
jgi:hypothetical protein